MFKRELLLATLAFSVVMFCGCSSSPGTKSDPVDVTVAVTLPKGQPGSNLSLMLFPTSSQQIQGGGKTDASGKVKTKLTPGTYTYSFDNGPASVPSKYHTNNASHTVEVTPATTQLEIKLAD